mgnify:CR=1 FL=1
MILKINFLLQVGLKGALKRSRIALLNENYSRLRKIAVKFGA